MVEVRRNGRQGVLVVNGETYGPVLLKKKFSLVYIVNTTLYISPSL